MIKWSANFLALFLFLIFANLNHNQKHDEQ